jgi:hypothetical protein
MVRSVADLLFAVEPGWVNGRFLYRVWCADGKKRGKNRQDFLLSLPIALYVSRAGWYNLQSASAGLEKSEPKTETRTADEG